MLSRHSISSHSHNMLSGATATSCCMYLAFAKRYSFLGRNPQDVLFSSVFFNCFLFLFFPQWGNVICDNRASVRENLTLLHANNIGSDKPAHPRSLISVLAKLFALRIVQSSADTESFVRGGPTLTGFFWFCFFCKLMRG